MSIKTAFLDDNTASAIENGDSETLSREAEFLRNNLGGSMVIITENADGKMYGLVAECAWDIVDDWHGECEYVPANDGRVFYAAWNNQMVDSESYTDFLSLLDLLLENIKKSNGWIIADFDGTGMLEIQKDDTANVFPDDSAAVAAAIAAGIRVIPIDELPANFERRHFGWIDTPENRAAIQAHCRNRENNSRK